MRIKMLLSDKNILVLGCGESGIAMANWCLEQNCKVSIADTRENPPMLAQLEEGIKFYHGINTKLIDEINPNIILLSPGLSPYYSPIKEIYKYKNIPTYGELWLFNQALEQLATKQNYHPKIIAITGTNGKTTTTKLTAHLCNYAGKTAEVAGNVSPSMLCALSNHLKNETLPQVWVLELSSFQLHDVNGFVPHASTILNISLDHLDWHSDMHNYIVSKFNIAGKNENYATKLILNRDDEILQKYIDLLNLDKNNLLSFGIDMPSNHDFGLAKQNDGYWLYHEQKNLMPINALKIRGLHNAQNAMAALALCDAIDIKIADVIGGLRTYQGEPHRVELIDIINDIEIYDDSKGTNVGATVAAINGLEKKIILIAGGDGKGQDFSDLEKPFKQFVQSVHLIGKDKLEIAKICDKANVSYTIYDSLEEATFNACNIAKSGEAVLLSPACASWDMFNNYAHRADVFCQSVAEWKEGLGIT
jgi:UDP-N-acetylmuramoylalanine--D-glutamate ligase